jgi:hypothetical protein
MPVINSATVETLTAEVRVLMVGSRQVTLSVFRQLDWIDYDEIEPFGRVNEGDGRVVVGKHTGTGVLARATLRQEDEWTRNDGYHLDGLRGEQRDLLRKLETYKESVARFNRDKAKYTAIMNDETKSLSERGSAQGSIEYLKIYETDPTPRLEANKKDIQRQEAWWKQSEKNVIFNRSRIASFNALPLIVLAGLR